MTRQMTEQSPPRYPYVAKYRLKDLLGISWENGMQDWPLEVSDSSRLEEFCIGYEAFELSTIEKFALMQLILYSLDESDEIDLWAKGETVPLVDRISTLLCRDFFIHLHTVDYWRLSDETDHEDGFKVTPLLRQVWNECYQPEYSRWLNQ